MDEHAASPGTVAPAAGRADDYAPLLRVQEAFEFAPSAHLRTDGLGVIREANHAAAALLRCAKEFLPGKPLGLFVAEGHRAEFYARLSRLWRGTGGEAFETRIGRRRGDPPRDVVVTVGPDRGGWPGDGPDAPGFRWQLADVTDRKRAEADRDDLLRRLVSAQEDERRRVARELHDSVGQLLTGLTLALRAARDASPLPPAAAAEIGEAQRLADELWRTLRDLACRLRPAALDDLGLHAALTQHLARWSARTGVEADLFATEERLPADVETAVYRIVQEALTNVARHARATRASVAVSRHGGCATATVEDNGAGFDPAAVPPGRLGLVGMRERAALAGGAVDIESGPGTGTTVIARFRLDGGGDS